MATKIDAKIKELSEKYILNDQVNPLKFLKRYLDDLFLIFCGSPKALHKFWQEINKIHPSIQFTMSHTSGISEDENCDCEVQDTIPFLDTQCKIENGRIETDLYRKPTDRNQYLLTSSCSPSTCIENIPYSLALRIVRICSKPEWREKRFEELKDLLLSRSYRPGLVDAAINRARTIPRAQALKRVDRPTQPRRPVNVVTFDAGYPQFKIYTRNTGKE